MKDIKLCLLTGIIFILSCNNQVLKRYGLHYQSHKDYYSLSKVVELMPEGEDTSRIKNILGEAINMGFDYRYLVDSTGPNGCVIGAVFHIDDFGKIDQQWIGEICE